MDRTILHIDANCFYASVECLYNPDIRNKPVAVVGDVEKRHGIILTANYIAKRCFGVKTGETVWQAKKKCPKLVTIGANMPLYIKFSKYMNKILARYSDMVESFGCDESWIDVTNSTKIFGSGYDIARQISDTIKFELGITVSIGVSFNKIFAKIGSDYKKPDAITEISKENYKQIVWPLPARDLLFVGKRTNAILSERNIKTIGDIANSTPETLKSILGKQGLLLYDFANGYDFSPVSKYNSKSTVKSISNSTVTYRDLVCNEECKMIFYVLADSIARRLREQGLFGKTISISVKNNQLSYFTRQCILDDYTNLEHTIATTAFSLFEKNYTWEHNVRALGINVSDLHYSKNNHQINIFADENKREILERLEVTQDDLKRRFGSFSIRRGILIKDSSLTEFDPKISHTVHPVSFKTEVF